MFSEWRKLLFQRKYLNYILKLYRESQEKLGRWCRVQCYWNYQCSATLEARGYGQITLLAKNKQAALKRGDYS